MWVSCSADLVEDAKRDLKDLKLGKIPVRPMTDWKQDKRIDLDEGVVFLTYSLLV